MAEHDSGEERDPVCGERVHPQTADHVEYHGRLYFFGSTDCQRRFLDAPEQFLGEDREEQATRATP